ncbi:MAG TPA: substrate-binding domain-containing protein [Puia sp.]|nr:substrate-binding domain-containing protein [Puia sp.]
MPLAPENKTPHPSNLIAMLVDHVSDPFFAGFARRIDRRARTLGYKLVLGSTENDISFMPKLISVFNNMNVAGYIIAPPPGVDPDLKKLLQKGKPVVLFDRYPTDPGPYTVLSDNFKGAYEAVGHFVRNGHRHIALVTVGSNQKRITDRRKGYSAAIDNHRLPSYITELPASASADQVKTAIRTLLQANKAIDAVLFADYSLTFTGLAALRQQKKRIPDHIAVIGFDDNENFQLFAPALTAVVQPLDEMVENILQCIAGHSGEKSARRRPTPIVLPTRMVIRSSTIRTPSTLHLSTTLHR